MDDLLLLCHRRKTELLVEWQCRRMVQRAGLHGHPLRPVRPCRGDRRTQEPAADALPGRVLHHAEIGEFHFLRQMRLEVEETGWRTVEVEHPDIAVLAVDAC